MITVAMSFHFEGDLFDRYWTRRILETDRERAEKHKAPKRPQILSSNAQFKAQEAMSHLLWQGIVHHDDNGHGDSPTQDPQQQRRVLELRLYHRTLKEMNIRSKEIFWNASLSLLEEPNLGYKANTEEAVHDVFLIATVDSRTTRQRAEQVQRVLRASMANLEENMAKVNIWQNRENNRQAENPHDGQ